MFESQTHLFKSLAGTFCPVVMLSACTGATEASGSVIDVTGQPIAGASVTLAHSERLAQTVQSDASGRYEINLEDRCFLICAGGNPTLSATHEGYVSSKTYVPQMETSSHDFILISPSAE